MLRSAAGREAAQNCVVALGVLSGLFETRATNSSNLESKSFRMGDWFDFLYPRTRSIVGVSPLRGRLVTDEGRKFCAYAGNSPTPPVDAIKDIPMARWSAS